MKLTGAAVLSMAAASQAFQAPMAPPRGGLAARPRASSSLSMVLSDQEVNLTVTTDCPAHRSIECVVRVPALLLTGTLFVL